jgi:hypothetical protein
VDYTAIPRHKTAIRRKSSRHPAIWIRIQIAECSTPFGITESRADRRQLHHRRPTHVLNGGFSRPARWLLGDGLLTKERSFFDYGYRHGEEFELPAADGKAPIAFGDGDLDRPGHLPEILRAKQAQELPGNAARHRTNCGPHRDVFLLSA